ncbi:hypothetical protein MMYC01_210389, partial [Madurella mycetomatis]
MWHEEHPSNKEPDQFHTVGYFESWNIDERGCLHMDVSMIPKAAPVSWAYSGYSHIHFAFLGPTPELM